MTVTKLDLRIDIDRLRNNTLSLIDQIPLDEKDKQLCLMHSDVCQNKWYDGVGTLNKRYPRNPIPFESSFNIINEELNGTYIEEALKLISKTHTVSRARLMMLDPKSCYSWHRDVSQRIHIAIETNPHCFLAFETGCIHIPADGNAYLADTRQYHSAFNGSSSASRMHLVVNYV